MNAFENGTMRCVAACLIAPCLVFGCCGCRSGETSGEKESVAQVNVSLRGELPTPRPADFVGSDVCRTCHAEISDLYGTHPMGRSMGALAEIEPIEQCPSGEIDVGGARKYRVQCDDDAVWHHEYLIDESGEVAYDQREEVRYAIGSGQRGRAYLIFKYGIFRQSPIGWYSTSDSWDLSPGYQVDSNRRFQRRVGDGCLYCHAGQVDSVGRDRYAEPPLREAAISCERCHGPAGDHVAFHHGARAVEAASDRIVNPAKLDVTARESVCNQCHLQGLYTVPRYGRAFTDFRPGDQMEDIFVTLVGPSTAPDGQATPVVSQVEQMRQSRCYIDSQAQLGCTSCHDPHAPAPRVNRDAYYRDRCNACHDDRGCSLPAHQRQAAPALGSCVHCHMPADDETNVPHTAQTDHRIVRDPSASRRSRAAAGQPMAADRAELNIFGDPELIPQWEQSRALGIAMMTQAWNRQDLALARQAVVKLVPTSLIQAGGVAMIAALTPDVAALNELAAFFWLTDNPTDAGRCWSHVLELEPENETALAGMALVSRRSSNLQDASDYLERLLSITPEDPQWLTQKTQIAWDRQRREDAFQTAEKVLSVDPTLIEFRQWLADAYRAAAAADKARAHEQTLRRLGH